MGFYIFSFCINLIIGLVILSKPISNKKKKYYLLITVIQLGLISGFRSINVGYDTSGYEMIFLKAPDNFSAVFRGNFREEIGFTLLCAIIKMLGGSFQSLIIITSLFVVSSSCIFIYRHSKNILLSIFIIISFPYYYSSFDIIRHFIATSFFLLGYKYILDKKLIKYLAYILLGVLFHEITIIFSLFYLIRYVKWNFLSVSVAIVVTILCYQYLNDIAIFLSALMGKTDYSGSMWMGSYAGGSKTAIMYFFILLISILGYKNISHRNSADNQALLIIFLLFLFSVVFINARMMIRLIMSCIPLLSIAIPQLFCNLNRMKSASNGKKFLYIFIFIGIIYHFFMLTTNWQNIIPYEAFWNI